MRLRCIIFACLLAVLAGCSADDPTRHNTYIPLTAIEIIPAYEQMADQTVNQYKAVGDFSGAFTRDITGEVAWTIADNSVASVSNQSGSEGLVTALKPGETSIEASYGDVTESAPVIVTSAFLTAIGITPEDAELQVDISSQYEAAGTFSDDSSQDITSLVTWESSDPEVATINSAGLVSTVASGITTLSGTWQGIEGSTQLLVTGAVLNTITIDPEETAIARGTTVQFRAEGTYSDDTTLDITDIVEWESSAAKIGVIDSTGLATGVSAGETEITASYTKDSETVSAMAALTVTNAVLLAISVTPANSTISAGSNKQFTATGRFTDDSEQDITGLASWSSSNPGVGTISNSSGSRGLFISTNPGITTIRAIYGDIGDETRLIIE